MAIQTARVDASTRQGQVGSAGQLSEVLGNGTVNSVKADLSAAELKLQELSSRYGDKHPQVQEARAAVNELKGKLSRAMVDVTGAINVDARVSHAREARDPGRRLRAAHQGAWR